MRHMKNYARCRKMVKDHFAGQRKEERELIALKERTLADPKCKDPRGGYYRFPEGTPYAGQVCDPATLKRDRKYLASLDKREQAWLDRLDRADRLGRRLREFHISVDWKKSRTWGNNPTAEIWVSFDYDYVGEDGKQRTTTDRSYAKSSSIGGCGYDKRSTAVSEAISKLDEAGTAAFDRLVVEAGEKVWKEYVFSKRPFPHISFGGKGMSTFDGLFPRMGNSVRDAKSYAFPRFRIEIDERGQTHDSYNCYRRDLL